jgi:dTDP-4-dehydrorhamnose 3,5-epimerase-like enzyme
MQLEFKEIAIKTVQAPNFALTPFELHEYIDFEVKRVYFITQPTGPTGSHCHLKEKELFAAIQGSCTAVIDRGNGLEEIRLNAFEKAIYIGNYVWHHFKDFEPETIVMAISSTNYNPNREDYITDYEEYEKRIKNKE